MSKGKITCLYGAKGGIGKTIFITNLAGIFTKLNKKVLLLDLDLNNGGIAPLLNKDVNKTIFNFCDDYVNNRFETIQNYTIKYNDNIDFIASPKDPRQANKISQKYIEILLDKSAFLYDIILIDTTHYLDEINLLAMDKADTILFMTTNDLLSLKNLKNMLNIMGDNDINKYKVILNNSVNFKNYFSLYDIKNILGTNIDYKISENFYYKKIDNLIIDGIIMSLNFTGYKDEKVLIKIANDILKGGI